MNKPKKINGNITLKRIDYNRVIDKIVIKNNITSGKITLPKDLIGKTVYVVWKEK
jgi:putative transposon-encoded protein